MDFKKKVLKFPYSINFLTVSYHIKICEVNQDNLSYNKDVEGDGQLGRAPLMEPWEAVGQRDFDQTEVKASQE